MPLSAPVPAGPDSAESADVLLRVSDLRVTLPTRAGEAHVLDNVSLTVARGETLGIVGESGCGKSMTALAILGMVPEPGWVSGGRIEFDGRDLRSLKPREMAAMRGRDLAIVFQDPMTSLNPVLTVETQICETIRHHLELSGDAARARALELLEAVEIVDARRRLKAYPHELSGGMRQRVLIAIALACEPKLLIADEPTTALDVTTQVQIMDLLADAQRRLGMAMILISHDMAVIGEEADRVAVMYAGKVAECSTAREVIRRPRHRYTESLIRALPVIGRPMAADAAIGGRPPDLSAPPTGCRFHPRCPHATDVCHAQEPGLDTAAGGRAGGPAHLAACWHPANMADPETPPVPGRKDVSHG
jgi:oligopeptide/dipeptide ABC transporter ATP-binding protein